jgi:hypothetical protein
LRNRHLLVAAVAFWTLSSVLLATRFALAPALATLAGAVVANGIVARGGFGELLEKPVDGRWLTACLLLGLLLATLGGEGHFFFSKDDWLGRDAVLADLVSRWAPTPYRHDGADFLLRAPLGMYLAPAAVGRILGLNAAHLALLAQNSLALGGFFYFVTLLWPRRRLAFVLLFVFFSGLDAIPVLLKTGGALLRVPAFWVEIGWFPAHLSQLFWGPTHALPGWWFAALAALHARRQIDLATLAAASLPLLLWSPLAVMGAAPLLLILAALSPRAMATPRFALACVAGLGFLPIVFYLRAGAEAVPHRFQWATPGFFDAYLLLILFGLTQAIFVAVLWRRIEPWFRPTLAAAIFLLLLSPVYDLGFMNDVTQRVTLAPRALLAFGFNALLIDSLAAGAFAALASGAAIFAVGAVSPAVELYDTLSTPRFSISDCNLLTVYAKHRHERYLSTYLAPMNAMPAWLFGRAAEGPPLEKEDRLCWPDRIHGEALFDWMKPENRIWLTRPKPPAEAASPAP